MTIDYSLEDLEQLLTVSSKVEYMSGLFCLHDAFKNVISQYDTLSSNSEVTDLLDDIKLGIAENQILLQESIGKPETEIISTSTLPPLFNELESTNADEMFKKNFTQYGNVVNILNNSYKQLDDGHSDDIQTSIKEKCDNWIIRCNEVNNKTSNDVNMKINVETKEEVKEEANIETKEEVKVETKEEVKVETKEEVNIETKEEVKVETNEEVKVETKEELTESVTCNTVIDAHANISDISDKMEKKLGKFMENFNSLDDGRKSVNDCMDQLSLFASKGLQVDSAVAPLKTQLKGIEELQDEYLTKLMKISQEFDSIINDMTKVTESGISN